VEKMREQSKQNENNKEEMSEYEKTEDGER
jgi:hypothetical protein